ncbi:outer membrane protein with beta-barrel domain [Flavobacteriaceae bacterium MAR_2010_105]|nr:outer membrane protein with beta-barrel domain [Flavobacteriaceae bacterium MAR_2010_105]
MKKHVLLIVFSLISMAFIQAQEFGFGIRGGLNTYTIGDIITVGSNGPQGPDAGINFEPVKDIGFQAGAYFFAQFGNFFVRPELNYVSSQNHYDFPDRQSKWSTSKIDFPILLGYEIFGPVSVYAGPGFNFFGDTEIEGVQETSFTTGSAGPDLKKSTFNINVGIMLRYKRLGIDLRYEMGQGETDQEREDFIRSAYGVNLADLKPYKPNVLSLSVFFDIFRTDAQSIGGMFDGLFKGNSCYCPF